MSIPFVLYPSHRDFVPGHSTLEFQAVGPTVFDALGYLVIILSLLAMIPIVFLIFYQITILPRLIDTFGEATTGHVIACEMVPVKSGFTPELTYSYTWKETSFQGTSSPAGGCLSYPDQKKVPVRLLPFDPTQSHLIQAEDPSNSFVSILMGIAILGTIGFSAIFIPLFAGQISAHRQASRAYPRLMSEGRLLRGEITAISSQYISKSNKFYVYVSYRFQLPSGAVLKGDASHTRQDLKDKPLPSVGTSVNILYADDNTYVML